MTDPAVARRFLDARSTMTLACIDADGPWAADVYYVRQGRALAFFSSPDSRHSRAFAADPRAAASVHGVYEGWEDIRGLQIEGEVTPVESPAEKAKCMTAYALKFPFVREFLQGSGKTAAEKVRLYRFEPGTVLWVDNSKGFGNREEIEW